MRREAEQTPGIARNLDNRETVGIEHNKNAVGLDRPRDMDRLPFAIGKVCRPKGGLSHRLRLSLEELIFTLWLVFNAIGDVPEIWVVFVGFVMASMAATIGPMPIGLGTFEAGAVGMLHFLGVSIEVALAGTLLLRGLTFWIPMLPGVWLARREIGRL